MPNLIYNGSITIGLSRIIKINLLFGEIPRKLNQVIYNTLNQIAKLIKQKTSLYSRESWEKIQEGLDEYKNLIDIIHNNYDDEKRIIQDLYEMRSTKGLGGLNLIHNQDVIRKYIGHIRTPGKKHADLIRNI